MWREREASPSSRKRRRVDDADGEGSPSRLMSPIDSSTRHLESRTTARPRERSSHATLLEPAGRMGDEGSTRRPTGLMPQPVVSRVSRRAANDWDAAIGSRYAEGSMEGRSPWRHGLLQVLPTARSG